MNTPLIEAIRGSWKRDEGDYETTANQYRISSVAYCSVKIYYDKITPKEQKKPFSDKTLGIFEVGTIFHEYIQNHLSKDFLISAENEITFDHKEISLIGHFDLLILDPVVGLKLSDIKTANSRAFKYRSEEASNHHKEQANTYAAILNVDFYSILYVEKDTFAMVEHEYQTSKEMFVETLKKLQTINEHVVLGIPPAKDGEKWECSYCPYEKRCLEDE